MLRKILNKFLHKNESTTLASIHDFVYIPKREDLTKEQMVSLEKYKREYLNILKAKKVSTSIELNDSLLNIEVGKHISMLLNIMEQEEDKIVSFEKINKEQEENKKLENQIKMGKLKLYFYRIVSIEEETTLRAVALLEILKEKFILSPNKKRSIKEEINHLAIQKLTFKNQIVGIQAEIERYLIDSGLIEEDNSPENAIEEKFNELSKIFEVLGLDQTKYCGADITNILFMEEEIEEYVYHHPEIEYLRDKVHFLSVEYYNKLVIRDYLKEIEEIEFKYKIYNDYGRKLVSYEETEKLYRFKFDIITSGIGTNVDFNITENVTYTELEIYMKIIEEKTEALVMGTNPNIRDTEITVQELLPLIIEILKNGEKEFSPWDILNDRKKLCLLLSFDKDISLEWFFHILDDRRREIYDMVDFYDLHMKWCELLPLSSIYQMMGYNIKCDDLWEQYNSRIEGLYFKLYQMYQEQYIKTHPEKERIFRFPEGITEIDFRYSDTIIDLLNKEMEGKDIYTPSTLKILGKLPLQTTIKDFYLNEGLEKIKCSNSFQDMEAKALYLPSSLNDVDNLNDVLDSFESVYLYKHQLYFKWVKEACIPIHILETSGTSLYVSENVLRDEEVIGNIETLYIDQVKDFETFISPFVYRFFHLEKSNCKHYDYDLAPNFQRLIIINESSEPIIFDKSELIIKEKFNIYSKKQLLINIKQILVREFDWEGGQKYLKFIISKDYFNLMHSKVSKGYEDVHIDYHENEDVMKKKIYEIFDTYWKHIFRDFRNDPEEYGFKHWEIYNGKIYLAIRNLIIHMPKNEMVRIDVSDWVFESYIRYEDYMPFENFDQFLQEKCENYEKWEEKLITYEKEAAKDFFYQKLQEKGLARVLKKL